MGIIKLTPAFKDYLWGGTKLKENYGKITDMDPLAESWELSVHKDGPSYVASGEYEGLTFPEYLEKKGPQVLGTNCDRFDRFPILIKFIDALQPLSIQVHPDNEYGLRVEDEYGKTEMWYIMDCEPGATLYFGVNQPISKEEFRERIENNTLLEVLNEVPVHKGDVFFIKAGTLHAIGGGIQICEIQQNSNTTYRVYDFGRVGKDGKPRELHIDKAIDVTNLEPIASDFKACGPHIQSGDAEVTMLATDENFTTFETTLDGTIVLDVDDKSFGSIIVIDGSCTISNDGEKIEAVKGDSIFIDAGSGKVTVTGKCSYIYTCEV